MSASLTNIVCFTSVKDIVLKLKPRFENFDHFVSYIFWGVYSDQSMDAGATLGQRLSGGIEFSKAKTEAQVECFFFKDADVQRQSIVVS